VYTAELSIFYVMQTHCNTSKLFIAEFWKDSGTQKVNIGNFK
jgi:hypothetical protein